MGFENDMVRCMLWRSMCGGVVSSYAILSLCSILSFFSIFGLIPSSTLVSSFSILSLCSIFGLIPSSTLTSPGLTSSCIQLYRC